MNIEQILQEIVKLPRPKQAFIAEKILEILDSEEHIEPSSEWINLFQQRLSDIDVSVVQMVKADEVMNQIWSELR